MRIMVIFFGVLLCGAVLSSRRASAQTQPDLVGSWTANVNGQQVVLTLNGDGTCELLGNRAYWQAGNGRIAVGDQSGKIEGTVQNGQIAFNYNGQQIVFSHGGGRPAAPAPGPAPAAPAPGGAGPQSLVGQWMTTFNGQQVVLTLNADGSTDFMGTRGQWQAQGNVIVVGNQQGQIQGTVQGGQITFNYNGQMFVFTRQGQQQPAPSPPMGGGYAPPAAPTASAGSFRPEKVLPGHTVTPEGTQVSFTAPKDWTGAWGQIAGTPVYNITVPGMAGKAFVGATAKVLGRERQLPMAQLLPLAAQVAWGQQASGTPLLNESFTVGGHPAGRVIYRGSIPGPTGAPMEVEGYMGLVIIDDWSLAFAGAYPVADADSLRAGMDTMLASVGGKVPGRDRQAEQQIVGCWETGGGSSNHEGGSYHSSYLRFQPDGSYTRTGAVSADPKVGGERVGSMDATFEEHGAFMIHAGLLTFAPNDPNKQTQSLAIRVLSGGLKLGTMTYIKCL